MGTTIYLPSDLVEILDQVQSDRKDPTRSDTVRFLLLYSLAVLSYLPEVTKKAIGLKEK